MSLQGKGNSKSSYSPRFSAILRIINPVKGSYLTAYFIFSQNCEILFGELQILYCIIIVLWKQLYSNISEDAMEISGGD